MRSLFWKIFLSFWLLVTGLAVVVLVTNSNRKNDRFDRFRLQQQALVMNSADYAIAEYEHGGKSGLRQALQKINVRIRGQLWVINDQQQPIQGGELPAEVEPAVTMPDEVTWGPKALLVRAPIEHEGHKYQALALIDIPRPPTVPWGGELSVQIILAILISSAICFVLAKFIARPVESLREAAQQISHGDLAARANVEFEGRDELGQLTRDFNHMADRLESTLNAQQRMFADVSHELRSPLSRLTLALELAKQRSGPAAATALERIEIETARLNSMVSQILRLAKLESGELFDRHEVVSVSEILGEIARDAELEANAKHCAVVLHNECSALVEGDAGVLRSAFENVVRNAIQYSPEKGQIDVVQRKCGQSSVAIEVADQGPGVPAQELKRLFEPFYRSDGSRTRATGGVGLGLAIAERAVVAHKGSIRAANRENNGLRIEIRLPMFGVEG